ncbi:MAG: DMT family transporter [Methyloligellaceae bacterium]
MADLTVRYNQRAAQPVGQGRSTYATGLLLTLTGVLLMTPDALLIRLIDVESWSLVIWRGGLVAIAMLVFLIVQFRGRFWRGFAGFGAGGFVAALALCFTNISFVTAMSEASVATVMVIFASVPFFGALIGWLGYGERVPLRTWVAMPFALAGLAIAAQSGFTDGNAFGIGLAFCGTLMLATYLTTLWHERTINNYAATGLGALCACLIALNFGDPYAVTGSPEKFGYTVLLALIILPAAMAFFSKGPKYISSAEVGLVLLLETVLGPFWVWLVLAEVPEVTTVIGGAVVLATLVVHSMVALRSGR